MGIPVMVTLGASAGAFFSIMKGAEASMLSMAGTAGITDAAMSKMFLRMSVGVIGAAAVFAGESIHIAADFESSMTHLVTAANLPETAVKDLGNQFVDLSKQVGTSAKDLADASYYVLSEGYQWQETSNIMHTAAQLSIEDQAPLIDTTRALVTTMHDYHAQASEATSYGNAFREMLARSGTTMTELAQNMGRVDQISMSLGMNFSQTAGALATLTREGMQGAQAETLLATAIGHLAGDTPKMTKELQGLGIDVNKFQQQLAGPEGLVGAITTVQSAIRDHLGEDGLVYLQKTLKDSNGNLDDFAEAMGKAPAKIQSYVAALGDAMGGSRNLGVILGLSGKNLEDFQNNVDGVSAAFNRGGKDVDGWSKVTDTLNFKTKDLNVKLQDMALKLGDHLLPVVDKIVTGLSNFADLLDRNRFAADAFNTALGVVLAASVVNIANKLFGLVGKLGELVLALGRGVIAAAQFAWALGTTIVSAIADAVVAIGRFIAAWAVMAWETIITNVGRLATMIKVTMIPALVDATAATWAWTVALLANPITWLVVLIVLLVAYIIALGVAIWWVANNWTEACAIATAAMEIFTSKTGISFEQLKNGIIGIGPSIFMAITSPFFHALTYCMGLLGQFNDLGRNIIQGIINGVVSMGGFLANAVSSVVSNAYHAALSVLGIRSPSRLFQEGVGVPIGQGIAVGIGSTGGLVSTQLRNITDPSRMGLGGGNVSSLGTGRRAGGQGQNVTFHLEVHGSLYGTNLQGAATEIWKQLLQLQRQGNLGLLA